MKANMPEKLYISDSELNDTEHCVIWFKNQQNENDIEYIRINAFIEKAIGWIDYQNRNGGCNFGGWEKDFEDYIKRNNYGNS